MNTIRHLQCNLTSPRLDMKAGQTACWIFSAIVMVGGLYKITLLPLTEPEFFIAILLLVAVSVLGLVAGLILPIAQYVAQREDER